jgi:GntR family transcriptional regulator
MNHEITRHERLRSCILQMITDGPGQGGLLASERDGAKEHRITCLMAKLVIEGLADHELVQSLRTFVCGSAGSNSRALTSFSQDMSARCTRSTSGGVLVTKRTADARAGRQLQINPAGEVIEVQGLQLANEVPMCLEKIQLPTKFVSGLNLNPLAGSMYKLLASRYRLRVTEVEQRVDAPVLDVPQARPLRVPLISPAQLVERFSCDEAGRPAERARSLYCANRFDFWVALERPCPSK